MIFAVLYYLRLFKASLDIISNYANNYQLKIKADKTRIVISGSKLGPGPLSGREPGLWMVSGLDE